MRRTIPYALLTVASGGVEIDADTLHCGSEIGRPANAGAVINEIEGANNVCILAAGPREGLSTDVTDLAALDGRCLGASESEDEGEGRSSELHSEIWVSVDVEC